MNPPVDKYDRNSKEQQNEHVAAMDFLLNIALPNADAQIKKDLDCSAKHCQSHWELLKAKWSFQMATAVLLVQECSDLTYFQDDEDSNEESETSEPLKKKKKRMHKKEAMETDLPKKYYTLCATFAKMKNQEGVRERMAAWDRLVCPTKFKKRKVGAAERESVCPGEKENKSEPCMLQSFLGSSQFSSYWKQPASVTPTSSEGSREMPPLIQPTQPSVIICDTDIIANNPGGGFSQLE